MTKRVYFGMKALPFWAGRHCKEEVLCHEFTRIFTKKFKNSCQFVKSVAKVLRLPVKNDRSVFIKHSLSGVAVVFRHVVEGRLPPAMPFDYGLASALDLRSGRKFGSGYEVSDAPRSAR